MLDLEKDIPCRVIDGTIHSARGQETWCDEHRVGDFFTSGWCDSADQFTDSISECEEEEHRFDEAGQDHDPGRRFERDDAALDHG